MKTQAYPFPSRALRQAALWVLGLLLAEPAGAYEYELGDSGAKAELKMEASFGARLRTQDRDASVLGKLNINPLLCDSGACSGVDGNERFKAAPGNVLPDYDNGDLNYDKFDVVQGVSRLSARLGMSYKGFGLFARGIAWYDPLNTGFDEVHPNTAFQPASTQRPQDAVADIGERYELMEAYAAGDLPLLGDRTLTVRVGNQITYWGESNFLVLNSVNAINPPNANRLGFAGGNPDEIFTPVPMVWLETKPIDDMNLEVFYEYGWEPVEVEPAGSYFSTDDTIGAGGAFAHLDGKLPEDPLNQVRPNAPVSDAGRTFYRLPDREPRDSGQYGAALDYFLPDLGEGTSFGLYFANYHSRLPVGSFLASRASSCRTAPESADASPNGSAVLPYCLDNGEPIPVDTLRYFLEYPEDIRMFGGTVVTAFGMWSLQLEYAYRPNLPVQVDTVDLTFAALQPAFPREDVAVPGVGTIPGSRHIVPDYVETLYRRQAVQPQQYVRGYERMKVGQLNLSTILLTPGNPFGASQVLLLIETGVTHVLDFPVLDQLQLEGPGTSNHYSAGIDGTGANGQADSDRTNITQQVHGFATQYSYGYRLYSEMEYPDLLFGLTFKPLFAVAHDVKGTAVGNGGNFIEGRKQFDVGLNVRATRLWNATLQHTWYRGAGEFNLLRDRDNLSLSVTFIF